MLDGKEHQRDINNKRGLAEKNIIFLINWKILKKFELESESDALLNYIFSLKVLKRFKYYE